MGAQSGTVVECLTQDRGVPDSNLTGVTVLRPWARHIYPCLVLVQPRKTRPDKLKNWWLGHKESNQIKQTAVINTVCSLTVADHYVSVGLFPWQETYSLINQLFSPCPARNQSICFVYKLLICNQSASRISSIPFCMGKHSTVFRYIWFFMSHQQSFRYIGTVLPGLNQYKARINVSCSRTTTQWRRWGLNPQPFGLESLYHWATALPYIVQQKVKTQMKCHIICHFIRVCTVY